MPGGAPRASAPRPPAAATPPAAAEPVAPARRGRPRAFDRDEALRRAMLVFWARGYEGASMALLVEAMGVNSPSIYAAFGSKEDLFREAVRLYATGDGGATWRALTEVDGLRDAVRAMLLGAVDAFAGRDGPRGCLVVLGARPPGGGADPIGGFLRDERRRIRDRIHDRCERAAAEGELRAGDDPISLAGLIMAFLCGLSIEAADGVPENALRRSVELFLARLP